MAIPPLRCPECGAGFQWEGANPHYNRARHIESAHLGGGHWEYRRTTKGTFENVPPGQVGKSPREDVNASARFNKKHQAFFEAEAEEAIRRARAGRAGERSGSTTHPTDTRTKEQKLEAMARDKSSPREAAVAKHMLFKRYGRKIDA